MRTWAAFSGDDEFDCRNHVDHRDERMTSGWLLDMDELARTLKVPPSRIQELARGPVQQ